MLIFAYRDTSLLNCGDSVAIAVAGAARRGQDDLDLDAMLRGVDKVLLDPAIVHFLAGNQQGMFGAADQGIEIAARIDRANDQVRIIEAGRSVVPIGLKNRVYGLYILLVGVDNIVFAVFRVVAGAQGRVGEVRGHDISSGVINDHALLVGEGEIRTRGLRLDA